MKGGIIMATKQTGLVIDLLAQDLNNPHWLSPEARRKGLEFRKQERRKEMRQRHLAKLRAEAKAKKDRKL